MFPLSFIVGFSMLIFGLLFTLIEVNLSKYIFYIVLGILIVGIVLVLIVFKRKNRVYLSSLFGVVLICILYLCRLGFSYYPSMDILEKYSSVVSPRMECVVLSKSREKNRLSNMYEVMVLVDKMEGEKLPFRKPKMRLEIHDVQFSVGDRIAFSSSIRKPGLMEYYKSKGVFWSSRVYSKIDVIPEGRKKLLYLFSIIKDSIYDTVYKFLPEDYASVSLGMLTGEKEGLSEELKNAFKMSGIIHLFSVSGFHVGMWGLLVNKGFLSVGFNKKGAALLSIFFVLFYMILTGASKSTLRASLMLAIFFIGRIFRQDSDSLASLGVATICILFVDPFSSGDMGFLLSFFATLGIIVLKTPSVSVSALILTSPIMFMFGGDISLVAPLTNFLCGAIASVSIMFCAVGTILANFGTVLEIAFLRDAFASACFLLVGLCDKYVIWVCEMVNKIPYMYISGNSSSLSFALSMALLFCAVSLLIPGEISKRKNMTILTIFFMFFISYMFLIFS
ncbi:MAG: ComEC/Rec2 family competence protein [Oscillospiraceae bacterium]|nr:ComEC/Rec2 family competence protein [Oscillospiraceae bacterium]